VLLAPAPTVLGTDGRTMRKSARNALELRDNARANEIADRPLADVRDLMGMRY
jgi:hypothetical protein